ncbi:MAG: flagellar basal body protein FliL [Shinella sp.]|nr:MAG: flagellar basal body protein FliL [Shinella sp.]
MITDGESAGKKKSALIVTIASVAVLSVVGLGGGWLVGKMLAPALTPPAGQEAPAAPEAKAAGGNEAGGEKGEIPNISASQPNLVSLDPIVTNLAYPSENWIRIELALLFNGTPDPALAEEIHQDVLAYLRTVSLQQVQGPRGFQYLRDDVSEIVDQRSQGRISKVLFRMFVIE